MIFWYMLHFSLKSERKQLDLIKENFTLSAVVTEPVSTRARVDVNQ